MKMKMLLASGLCFALTSHMFAQDNKLQDSVYITPFASCKIVLVGKSINKLLHENNLEILKNKFIEDYRESAKDKDFPANAKNIIYLASQDGRRRLKAMPDEYITLNIENEIKSFKSDLPLFHYTIYDLTKAFEYHIYVKDSAGLGQLYKLDFSLLLKQTIADNPVEVKRYRSIAVTPTATSYNISRLRSDRAKFLSANPVIGVGLINSTLSPMIGFDADYVALNKYGKHNFKIGLSYSFNVLADYQNKAFTNFNSVHNSDFHFLRNISHSKEDFFFGFSLGKYYTDKVFGSAREGTLDKAWKFGIMNQFRSFGIEYNFIYDKNGNRNAGFTFHYYF